MQAEAAIPEDILDQQHIQDVDGIDADSMQYVSESDVVDGDAVAEPEADIILAAQKFSTSENSHEQVEEQEKYAQLKNSAKSEHLKKNSEDENSKLSNQEAYGNNNNNNKNGSKNNIKTIDSSHNNDNTAAYFDSTDELDGLDADTIEEPLALPRTTEAKTFQLTINPKEQQNHKLITEGGGANDGKVGDDVTGQQQPEHLQLIENLATRKFNKAPSQTADNVGKGKDKTFLKNNNNKYGKIENNFEVNNDKNDDAVARALDGQRHSNKSIAINKDNNTSKQVNKKSEMYEYMDGSNQAEEEMAIGDIEDDKFHNEDEGDEREQLHEHKISLPGVQGSKSTSSDSVEKVALTIVQKNDGKSVDESDESDDYEYAPQRSKFIPKKIKRHDRTQSVSRNSNIEGADADNNNNNYSNNNNKRIHNIRHHYGEPHEKLGENFANTFTQMAVAEKVAKKVAAMPKNQPQHQQEQQTKLEHIDEVIDSSRGSNEAGSSQADYSITYFGILTNSTKKREKLSENGEEAEEEEEESGEVAVKHMQRTSENSVKIADNIAKIADSVDVAAKVDAVHHAIQNKQQNQEQQKHDGTPKAAFDGDESYSSAHRHSAFEHFKALRRNTRRYGHKMHKKKYKNYLRYAPISTSTGREIDTIKTAATITTSAPLEMHAATGKDSVNTNDNNNTGTQTELTNNNSLRDYYRQQQQHQEQIGKAIAMRAEKHAEKLRKYARKIEEEKSRGLPASPIFVVSNRSAGGGGMSHTTTHKDEKPFYEGQINYFLETSDDDEEDDESAARGATHGGDGTEGNGNLGEREQRLRAHERSMERMIAADNNNWYRRVSPVLRNGIKVLSSNEGKHEEGAPARQQQQHAHKHPWQQRVVHQHRNHHHHRQANHYNHERQHQPRGYQQHHKTHHQHRQVSSSSSDKHQQHKQRQHNKKQQLEKGDEKTKHKLLPSAHDPPSPHAADTAAAVKIGMVQTPIPPPAYSKQQHNERQASLNSDALKLGHQITELEEFERYYAKWPHLARVRFQVYDEHYREAHPELYPEMKKGTEDDDDVDDGEDEDENYDDDYESAAELEEAQNGRDEDANLPPYIKKYNRRNKQLLNLLEGTLPPPTRLPSAFVGRSWSSSVLQPGPHASSRSAGGGDARSRIRIDDDYLKEKRKRYHNQMHDIVISTINKSNRKEDRHHYQDLFAQQRAELTPSTNETERTEAMTVPANVNGSADKQKASDGKANVEEGAFESKAHTNNQLPDEDISISADTDVDAAADRDTDMDAYAADDGDVAEVWPKEIENKSNANELTGSQQMTWQIEKLATITPNTLQKQESTPPSAPSTPKALVFRLPSYPAIAGNFIGKPRSRSAQFAPSGGSRGTLAFVAPANTDFHSNRWSNIYGKGGGGGGGGDDDGGSSNLIGHKSLSRFTPYKASVHRTLTAAAAAQATDSDSDASIENVAPNLVAVTPSASEGGGGSINGNDADGAHTESGATNVGAAGHNINTFVYHRVIDASPRLVGTGATGRKQRLPFVAITDRRLETTKKAQIEQQKEFEQNQYPMP